VTVLSRTSADHGDVANHGPKCEKRERHGEVDQVGGHRASLYDAQDKARRMAAYRPLCQQLQSLALTPIERFLIVDAWTARVAKSA
jgi:hypothetical protein